MSISYLISAVVAYLLGSIPFGLILVRVFTGTDVRSQGSGNIGATNVARTGRKELAIATLFLDALKGYLAVRLSVAVAVHSLSAVERAFWHAGQSMATLRDTSTLLIQIDQKVYLCAAIAAFFAVLGHMFPVWLKFKGGKGVATGLGVFLALAPKSVLLVVAVFAITVAVTRYVSLGSILAAALFPVSFWLLNRKESSVSVLVLIAGVSLLIIYKHKDNIGRLAAGNENKLGQKRA